jgi:hypothetical protein
MVVISFHVRPANRWPCATYGSGCIDIAAVYCRCPLNVCLNLWLCPSRGALSQFVLCLSPWALPQIVAVPFPWGAVPTCRWPVSCSCLLSCSAQARLAAAHPHSACRLCSPSVALPAVSGALLCRGALLFYACGACHECAVAHVHSCCRLCTRRGAG